jgi:hypothetical protein
MQNCKRFGSLWLALAATFILTGEVWGISGTVTDNRISAGGSTVMVFAIPHQAQLDPYLVEIECLGPVSGTYPNYTFNLPCSSSGNYDVGVVVWDGPQDTPPSLVTDMRLSVPFDTTGLVLSIQPNVDHISGDLYESGTGSLITTEAQIWAFDQSGNLVGLTFSDTLGHFEFGYLPGGAGPYDLSARVSGYWEGTAPDIPNPGYAGLILQKAFAVRITRTANRGYNYNDSLHPERTNWILSDASNYNFTLEMTNAKSLPIDQVMIRLPGGALSLSKFQADPSPAAHLVGPGLDWDSVWVDQNGIQDKVLFAQGNGVEVIKAEDTSEFTIQVVSMLNVSFDNYTGVEVTAFKQGGGKKAYAEAGLVQKILRITDLSFFPSEVDTSNQTGPNSIITVSATVENHGTGVFYPYDNWSNIWSPAFASPGTKFLFGSLPAGGSSTMALMDVQVTGTQGSYEINCNVSDSNDQNISYAALEESLVVTATDVREQDGSGNLPKSFTLKQNIPNPFNAATRIDFSLIVSGQVSLEIYNLLGQKVRTLVSEYLTSGFKSVIWDGKDQFGNDLASGLYFYRLKTAQTTLTKKMALIR